MERPKFIKNMLFDLYSDIDQYMLNIDYFLEEISKFAERGENFRKLIFGWLLYWKFLQIFNYLIIFGQIIIIKDFILLNTKIIWTFWKGSKGNPKW